MEVVVRIGSISNQYHTPAASNSIDAFLPPSLDSRPRIGGGSSGFLKHNATLLFSDCRNPCEYQGLLLPLSLLFTIGLHPSLGNR